MICIRLVFLQGSNHPGAILCLRAPGNWAGLETNPSSWNFGSKCKFLKIVLLVGCLLASGFGWKIIRFNALGIYIDSY